MIKNEDYLKGKLIVQKLNNLVHKLGGKIYETNDDANYYNLPTTVIKPDNKDLIAEFNNIYKELKTSFKQLIRTKSGGVSIKAANLINNPFQFDIRKNSLNITLTYLTDFGSAKVVVGYRIKNGKKALTGKACADTLLEQFTNAKLDVAKYESTKEDGEKLAKAIHKPENNVYGCLDKIYENVHHIDFHKFYPGGISLAYPEFREVFQELANKAKENEDYKQILDAGTRFFASQYCDYKYAVLIKDGIDAAYERFFEVLNALRSSGRKILLTNTDGIWYQGEIYHGKYEGLNIAEWSNDYTNCTFRMRSVGAYEFISNNIYYPKVKGVSSYERICSREEWSWGDIYKGEVIRCYWDDDEGFIVEEGEEEEYEIN